MYDLSTLIEPLIALASQASETILDIYRHSRQYPVHTKEDHSPVTQADLMANDILREGLHRLTPGIAYLSEEGSKKTWQERQAWQEYWLVDPLDGTREFLGHSGEFTINIALIREQQPVLGILYVPVSDECYYACQGQGAYKRLKNTTSEPIHSRNWQTDETLLLVSKGAREEILAQKFANLGKFSMIRMSSALKFAKVAEGFADIAPRFGDTSEWDTAAGQCILEEAGGGLLSLQGTPLRYNTKESLLNPHFIALGDMRLRDKIKWDDERK